MKRVDQRLVGEHPRSDTKEFFDYTDPRINTANESIVNHDHAGK